MTNFNEIFTKDVIHDYNKSHKNQGFTFSLEDAFLEKPKGWMKLTHLPQLFKS